MKRYLLILLLILALINTQVMAARLFDDGNPDDLQNANAVLSGTPLSIAAWFNTNDLTIDQTLVTICDTAGDTNYFNFYIAGASDGDYLLASAKDASGVVAAISSLGVSVNTWHHGLAIYTNSTSRTVYLDEGNVGTNATDRTPAGLDITAIGRLMRATPAIPLSGLIAEVAIWNDSLTAAEAAILAAGYSPLFVRPQNLVAYWPLVRGLNDKVGGYNMTASGTAVAAHPRIIYPAPIHFNYGEAAAPPAGGGQVIIITSAIPLILIITLASVLSIKWKK